jgi:hypothetical protein
MSHQNKAVTEALIVSFLALGAACGEDILPRAAGLMRGLLTDGVVELEPEAASILARIIVAAESE